MSIELILKTERLFLRPISVEDLEDVYPHVTDPEIARHMSWEPHKNKGQTLEFLERLQAEMHNEKTYTWSIFINNQFCGIVSLLSILRKHRALTYNRGELAYWVSRDFHKKGIMTEACKHVIDFAFSDLNLHRLTVSHATENKASEALIKKLNFHYIGEEREAFQKNGIWLNHSLYELLEKDLNTCNSGEK
jgi:RimJ/RimL family protein N-acetyltransferase